MKNEKFFKCASIGGTFNSFHKGHKEYIDIAFSLSDFVYIHIISDDLAKKRKNYFVNSFQKRITEIRNYILKNHGDSQYKILHISANKEIEKSILTHAFDIVVVEPAYFTLFNTFNKKRFELGKNKFCIIYKPRTLNRNGIEISSTQIENEKIIAKAYSFSSDLPS